MISRYHIYIFNTKIFDQTIIYIEIAHIPEKIPHSRRLRHVKNLVRIPGNPFHENFVFRTTLIPRIDLVI